MVSIYHFFQALVENREGLKNIARLEDFPFDSNLLSCRNKGLFPDMAIRINTDNELFIGGEFIELKDSSSYSVPSFNSTIPTGKKEISKIIIGENSLIKQQMQEAGDDITSLPVRDVYYLIRGQKKGNMKVLLVHGSFFETINTADLISQSFLQVLEERLQQSELEVTDEIKKLLVDMMSEQDNFSKVRSVDKASVKLRFRIMTEVKAEGNILNPTKYPEITDNTLNFVIPSHTEQDDLFVSQRMEQVFGKKELDTLKKFRLKHHFNGYFRVFQKTL